MTVTVKIEEEPGGEPGEPEDPDNPGTEEPDKPGTSDTGNDSNGSDTGENGNSGSGSADQNVTTAAQTEDQTSVIPEAAAAVISLLVLVGCGVVIYRRKY